VKDPVAVYCWFRPRAILWLIGEMAIDTNSSAVTIRVDTGLETTESYAAVIRVVPVASDDTSPFDPAVLLIVATPIFDDDQVAHVVRSCWVPSRSVPEAVNCFEVPLAMLVMVGDVEMVATGDVVSEDVPVSMLNDAEIVVMPGAVTAAAKPDVLTPATAGTDEVHVVQEVRFCDAALASVPHAENCSVMPRAMLGGFNGVTDSDTASDVVSATDPVRPL